MTILITGGAGFIGSNFLYYLAENDPDFRLICLDNLSYAGNYTTISPLVQQEKLLFIKADVCDRNAVFSAFEETKPELVVHFAAESHVDRSISDPSVFLRTNVLGTGVLLDACRTFGVVRFHLVSTDEVYGDLPLNRPELLFTESSPLRPRSPYAASKAAADLLALSYFHTYGVPVTISRCSNNYGRFQYPEKLIPRMIARALNEQTLPVYGTGENIRDWIHVSDHCAAIKKILLRGTPGEIYNVGANCPCSNLQLVRRICGILGIPRERIVFVEDRKGHDLRYGIDARKLETSLNWRPKVDFTDGLQETAEWYIANHAWWEPLYPEADKGSLC